jgi:RimJ/RimL family protein N-acetyltransferase
MDDARSRSRSTEHVSARVELVHDASASQGRLRVVGVAAHLVDERGVLPRVGEQPGEGRQLAGSRELLHEPGSTASKPMKNVRPPIACGAYAAAPKPRSRPAVGSIGWNGWARMTGMPPPPPSRRLDYREMSIDDVDLVASLLGDSDVMRYYERPRTRDEAKGWVEWNLGLYRDRGLGLWLTVDRISGDVVGECGLTFQDVEGVQELELGYHVFPSHWRRGYATEAASACVTSARTRGFDRLTAITDPRNIASIRTAERVGLVFERTFRRGEVALSLYSSNLS